MSLSSRELNHPYRIVSARHWYKTAQELPQDCIVRLNNCVERQNENIRGEIYKIKVSSSVVGDSSLPSFYPVFVTQTVSENSW